MLILFLQLIAGLFVAAAILNLFLPLPWVSSVLLAGIALVFAVMANTEARVERKR